VNTGVVRAGAEVGLGSPAGDHEALAVSRLHGSAFPTDEVVGAGSE
jgi:hypothetical protein